MEDILEPEDEEIGEEEEIKIKTTKLQKRKKKTNGLKANKKVKKN